MVAILNDLTESETLAAAKDILIVIPCPPRTLAYSLRHVGSPHSRCSAEHPSPSVRYMVALAPWSLNHFYTFLYGHNHTYVVNQKERKRKLKQRVQIKRDDFNTWLRGFGCFFSSNYTV